jgi:hypothetical protein
MRIACYLFVSLPKRRRASPKREPPRAEGAVNATRISAGDKKGGVMARKRKSQFTLPEKQCWHLYSLQNLHPEKFIKVVGKILKKDYLLIK